MEKSDTKELWGVDFRVVPDGLAEDQVVSFVDNLMEQNRSGRDEQDRQDSLRKLAEQTVVEADKLADDIKQQARQDAEDEAARTRSAAEEQARTEADRIVKQSERDAAAESRVALARAEKQAQDIVTKARFESKTIIQASRDRATTMEAEAKLEAEYIVRRLTVKFVEEVRSVVTETSNSILPSLDAPTDESDGPEALGEGTDGKFSVASSSRKKK